MEFLTDEEGKVTIVKSMRISAAAACLAGTLAATTSVANAGTPGNTGISGFKYNAGTLSATVYTNGWARHNLGIGRSFYSPTGSQFGSGSGACDNSTQCVRGPSSVFYAYGSQCPQPGEYSIKAFGEGNLDGLSNTAEAFIAVSQAAIHAVRPKC